MSVAGSWEGVGLQLNKFEQAPRFDVWGTYGITEGVPLACDLSYDACDVDLPPPQPTGNRQTPVKNTTFMQLSLRVVIMSNTNELGMKFFETWSCIMNISMNKQQDVYRVISIYRYYTTLPQEHGLPVLNVKLNVKRKRKMISGIFNR